MLRAAWCAFASMKVAGLAAVVLTLMGNRTAAALVFVLAGVALVVICVLVRELTLRAREDLARRCSSASSGYGDCSRCGKAADCWR